jgi:hypothetical protein
VLPSIVIGGIVRWEGGKKKLSAAQTKKERFLALFHLVLAER